jgi:hypothetical protein
MYVLIMSTFSVIFQFLMNLYEEVICYVSLTTEKGWIQVRHSSILSEVKWPPPIYLRSSGLLYLYEVKWPPLFIWSQVASSNLSEVKWPPLFIWGQVASSIWGQVASSIYLRSSGLLYLSEVKWPPIYLRSSGLLYFYLRSSGHIIKIWQFILGCPWFFFVTWYIILSILFLFNLLLFFKFTLEHINSPVGIGNGS